MFKLEPQAAPIITKCKVCGRTLTDPESIREGAGRVCRGESSKKCQEKKQMSLDFSKPELIICMENSGFDAQGKQIVSGKDEIELATNILKMFTEPNKDMAKAFVEVIREATRGVVRQKGIEEFIRDWRARDELRGL